MQRVLGFLISIGVGLVLSAWGLIYSAQTLLYAGVIVLAEVVVLWIWSLCFARKPQPASVPAPVDVGPPPQDSAGKALHALRSARESAAIARGQRGDEYAAKAFHQLEAAMLSIKREFGIGPLRLTSKSGGTIPYKELLPPYMAFIDQFYPLLREGHVPEAVAKASSFRWKWGEEA